MRVAALSRYRKSLALLVLFLSWAVAGPQAAQADSTPPPNVKPVAEAAATDNSLSPKNINDLRAIETQVKAVVAKVLPSVVGVQLGAVQGSGVIVSRDGLVMTAAHVVGKPGQKVLFRFFDGKTAKGITLGTYKEADAGLMKITDKGDWPFAEKGRSADIKPGTWCVAMGHPLGVVKGRPPVVRIGRVLRLEMSLLQTDCPVVSGDSGGPVFDLSGKVIGINSRIGPTMTANLHVPVDIFTRYWDHMVKGEAWKDDSFTRDSDPVKTACRDAVAEAGHCVVRVKCDGKDAALGTIVGPEGWVLTKASELKGKITCHLRDQRELDARIVGVNPNFDLAMLKIDATDLPAISWSQQPPVVGQWALTPGMGELPLSLGILSAPRRTIPPIPGVIGVNLTDAKNGIQVESVVDHGPAKKAGVKAKDIITQVNGKGVKKREELVAAVRRHKPGEKIKLTIRRGAKTQELAIELVKPDLPGFSMRNPLDRMAVPLSNRSDDLPGVLQHDTVLKPEDCGGPLVDLNGKVVGVNIAHAGRTASYCLPSDELLPLMYDLMSGRLIPPEIKAAAEGRCWKRHWPRRPPGTKLRL